MGHKHVVVDTDNHFKIDPVTRKIMPETPAKNELVQYDHNSERYTFEIPRLVDGHDMSLCDSIEVHFINISANAAETSSSIYEIEDLGVMDDDADTVAFTWLISGIATKLVGTLNFAIRFKCTSGGTSDYVWNTKVHSGIIISDGISNSEIVIAEYADVLEQWRQKLFGIGDTEEQKIRDASLAEQTNIANKGAEALNDIETHTTNITEDITEAGNGVIDTIAQKETEAVNNINDRKEEALNAIEMQVTDITEAGNGVINTIAQKETEAVNNIANKGAEALNDIETHTTNITEDITEAGNGVIDTIAQKETEAVNNINDRKEEAINNLQLETGLVISDGKLCVVFSQPQN